MYFVADGVPVDGDGPQLCPSSPNVMARGGGDDDAKDPLWVCIC